MCLMYFEIEEGWFDIQICIFYLLYVFKQINSKVKIEDGFGCVYV